MLDMIWLIIIDYLGSNENESDNTCYSENNYEIIFAGIFIF